MKQFLTVALAIVSMIVAMSCSKLTYRKSAGSYRARQTDSLVQVDQAKVYQTIVGFGGSSGWTSPTMDNYQADAFFTVDKGLGFSLLRLRIAPDGTTLELATAKQAVARGASVWASPWTPPAEWKDNHDVNNGGHLLPENHQDWADRLVSFAKNCAAEGVPLIGISARNEPGYIPQPPNSWEVKSSQDAPASWVTGVVSSDPVLYASRPHRHPGLMF